MLEIKNVYKTFNAGTVNEKVALKGLDLTLEDGDFVTVIGGNGAGKSTMLNAVAGVWPVDMGKILIDGQDVTRLSEHQRAKYIGRVFQDPMMGTAATMQIDENLALAARRGLPRTLKVGITKKEHDTYYELLKTLDLGLEERMTSKVGLLSGGQRQAVTLLMATLKKPKLLLLDEHTAALDPKTAAKVLTLSEKIVEENHLTTLMITHNMKDAIKYGNRLIMMYEGHIIYDVRGEEKKNLQEHTACLLMQKDLERIVKSVTPDADDIIKKKSAEYAESDLSEELTDAKYEEAGRSFEAVLKDEQKKRTAFLRARDLLVDRLTMLKAYELAQEIKQNIQPPQSQAEADELSDALRGTAGCIVLERDRISRGIEDMELIKSNFENRCVQICTNIRSELERLDKLSRITLDDEVIPVLSLQIPYIKEEMYKDRMSVYINETVSSAENFKTIDERLKYIRGRLSWKRLFSVIVTDMNSIRLNLYKRERIKDQSRYLRYEEAVGSTGQSQGIYIQFLVSIINYIASINAGGKEAAVLGKTIFIDNPFGAAKDVYIWEPIFKLLKTNHVQLIVPARGATPAITGRFDVNYVLGQKLVDKKQQTVVVDYHSQVAEQELEYERLSFSQESFDFL